LPKNRLFLGPQNQQTRHRLRFWVALAVHKIMAAHQPPQLADMGLGHALEQHHNADHHSQQQAIKHTQHNHGSKAVSATARSRCQMK
jgi:hypothetical protein